MDWKNKRLPLGFELQAASVEETVLKVRIPKTNLRMVFECQPDKRFKATLEDVETKKTSTLRPLLTSQNVKALVSFACLQHKERSFTSTYRVMANTPKKKRLNAKTKAHS